MKPQYRIYILAALAIVAVAGILAYKNSKLVANQAQTASTVAQAPTAESAAAEQKFIEQMIAHHADAIGMAQIAPDKAKNPEVKALAANIGSAQQKEIDEMKSWYKAWFNKDIPEMTDMSGMSEQSGNMMNQLRTAGNFDLAFVTQMIPHHQAAVTMAKDVLPQATHQQLKDLATLIITGQTAEIAQMQKLKQTLEQTPAQ